MKRYKTSIVAAFISLLFCSSCTEDTGSVGLYPEQDDIRNSYSTYEVSTKSTPLNSILYTNTYSYLGRISDPETKTEISACFAAQFHTFEDYTFPDKELVTAATGTELPTADSIFVRVYIDEYYGDKNNPMKLEVFPLRKDKIMEEDTEYTTDTDLEEYADISNGPIATKMFTPRDYNLSDDEVGASTYTNNIEMMLPNELGNSIMQAYYDNPSLYKDSYTFIRKVFPGLFFRIKSGTGTMLRVLVSTINIHFRYKEEGAEEATDAVCRFAATPEVIQSTRFSNGDLSSLINDPTCTFLKTPAGICTEMTLPVDEIFLNHENDSISKALLTLTRYNDVVSSAYSLEVPQNVLMVRKQDASTFFKERKVSDSQTSFTTSFVSAYNTYTFSNISRLISYCYYERMKGMEDTGKTKDEWESEHPDWNKVLIIPVKVATSQDTYGNTYETSVTHDMNLNSVKLVGGSSPMSPVNMQVVYSHFK